MMFLPRAPSRHSVTSGRRYESDNLKLSLSHRFRLLTVCCRRRLAESTRDARAQLQTVEFYYTPPFKLAYCLVSHERVQNSAPHQWLRRTIGELFREL